MRLFEAIMDANHRAIAGDASAGLHPGDFSEELPVAALTCIDARLNALFPDSLALPKEQFIWLRNAGNIITGPLSSTMRSLALACAIKGAREIAIIGHTDCLVGKTTTMKLTDALRVLGVERSGLPENLTQYFGLFASERQNVMKAVDFVRHSPLIGPKIPVHGLIIDVATGKLEWVVNGYQAMEMSSVPKADALQMPEERAEGLGKFASFNMGEMKFPDAKIGEHSTVAGTPPPSAPQPVPAATQPAPVQQPATVPVPPRLMPNAPRPFAPRPPVPPRISWK